MTDLFKYDITALSNSDLGQLYFNLCNPGAVCLSDLTRLRDCTHAVEEEIVMRTKTKGPIVDDTDEQENS